VVFTVEALLKMVAMGVLVHKHSYFKSFWNIIDFFVVITGLMEMSKFSELKVSSLRTLRILRPMRSLSTIPGLRRLVSALLKSLPEFLHIAMFLMFTYVMFSILGLSSFQGDMYWKCRLTEFPVNSTHWPKDPDDSRCCSGPGKYGAHQCSVGKFCGHPT
jgi:hypothetical protein